MTVHQGKLPRPFLGLLFLVYVIEAIDDLDPTIIARAIQKEAIKLSLADFDGDPIFIQTIDKANVISTYRLQSDSNSSDIPTFEQEGDDGSQEVVVLQSLSKANRKEGNKEKLNSNVFVVLRLMSKRGDLRKKYYATYVYTREPTKEDKYAVQIGSSQKLVFEWDTWEFRDGNNFDSIIDCKSSLIASCDYNSTIFLPKKKHVLPPLTKEDEVKEKKLEKMLPLIPAEGFSIKYNLGIFDDLDDSASKARKIGRAVRTDDQEASNIDRSLVDLNKLSSKAKPRGFVNQNFLNPWVQAGGDGQHKEIVDTAKSINTNVKYDKSERFTAVTTKRKKMKLMDGTTREEKITEYVSCKNDNCPENQDIFERVCNKGVCEMRLATEEAESNQIYKLIWVTQKQKKSDGTITEEKVRKYIQISIFVKTCSECTEFRQVTAREHLSNAQLFTLVKVNTQVESGSGKMVDKSIEKYVALDEETITNLYKKKCPKGTQNECEMVPLFEESQVTPTESNGEYTLFLRKTKTIKKGGVGGELMMTEYSYTPAPVTSSGPFFTKVCNKAHICSWEGVSEPKGPTGFYRLLKFRRKTTTPTGQVAEEEIYRFEAQPQPSDPKDFYVKFCYAELFRCVMKPYAKYKEEVSSGTQFFRLVLLIKKIRAPNGETRQEIENKYMKIKVAKKECDDAAICLYFPVTSADEFKTIKTPSLFISDVENEKNGKNKYRSITATSRLELYTSLCSPGDEGPRVCGMSPVIDEGQTKQLYRQLEPGKYTPTFIYRKQCEHEDTGENCSMELLTSFQNRILINRSTLYILITRTKKNRIVNDFEPVSPNDSFYDKYCEDGPKVKKCGFKVIDADPRNRIYSRTRGTSSIQNDKYEPITLYGRECMKGDAENCEMIMLTGESTELRRYVTWFTLKPTSEKKDENEEYLPLSPAAIDNLYRKVCTKNDTCLMKPLKEDKENTYYALRPKVIDLQGDKGTKGKETTEYVPILIFSHVCKVENPNICEMVPLRQGEDPSKYPLFELNNVSPKAVKKGQKEVIQKEYDPLNQETLTTIYQKQCGVIDKSKCSFYPIMESVIFKSVIEPNPENPKTQVRKYVPVNIYRKVCEEGGKSKCSMALIRASDDRKTQMYVKYEPKDPKSKDEKTIRKYILFDPEDKSIYYKKVCKGGICSYEPLFEDEQTIVRLLPSVADPTGPPNLTSIDSTKIVPIVIQRRVCTDKSNCEFSSLKLNDDPRDYELYEVQATKKIKPTGEEELQRKYIPLLSTYNPYLFQKRCSNSTCTFTPFFLEDMNSIYRTRGEPSNEVESLYTLPTFIPSLTYKKICKAGNRNENTPKQCEMQKLLYTDNPATFEVFEKENVQVGTEIIRHYNPLVPEVDGKNYYRKICLNVKSSACEMKLLYESDTESIFRQVTVMVTRSTPSDGKRSEPVVEYKIAPIYIKLCSNRKVTCDFTLAKATQDLSVQLYELTVRKQVSRDEKSKKTVTLIHKTFKALPHDAKYELYTQSCPKQVMSKGDCIYVPIIEDENTILRLIPTDGDRQYSPFRMYKRTCPNGEQNENNCTMSIVLGNDSIPEDVYTEIKSLPGSSKRKFLLLPPEEVSLLYTRTCDKVTETCSTKPLRPDTVYKLQEVNEDGTIQDSPTTGDESKQPNRTRQFVPMEIFKSICPKNNTNCTMTRFRIPQDDPKCEQIYELAPSTDENTPSTYRPITPETINKLYTKSCIVVSDAGGELDKNRCQMLPLIEATIFHRRVVKKIKILPDGEIEEERREEMKPMYSYIKTNNPSCPMKILSASDYVKQEGIFESIPPLPTDKDRLVKKFYPMEPDDVERLYKKVCVEKIEPNQLENCTKVPLFPKNYYEWRIIIIKNITYQEQVPIRVFKKRKACQEKEWEKKCLSPLEPSDDAEEYLEIYKLAVTYKKKNVPSDPDELETKYVLVPPEQRDNIHHRVCNKEGFCIPKKITEKSTKENIPVFKLMTVLVRTPDNETKAQEQYVPIKIFRRTGNNSMERITKKDGPIEDFKDPIYVKLIIVRKKKTLDTDVEERVNKFVKFNPITEKNIFLKQCSKVSKNGKEVCAMVTFLNDNPTIFKKVIVLKPNSKQNTIFTPVRLYMCKKSKINLNDKCTMTRVLADDNFSDPKSPVYMFVQVNRNGKLESRLVRVTPDDIQALYVKSKQKGKMEKLKPTDKLNILKLTKTTTTTPSTPMDEYVSNNFVEVPSDTSIEADTVVTQTDDMTEDVESEVKEILIENSIDPSDTTDIPKNVGDEPIIIEIADEVIELIDEEEMTATQASTVVETQVEVNDDFTIDKEVDEVIKKTKNVRDDLIIITKTKIVTTILRRKSKIEVATEEPLEKEVVMRVTEPSADIQQVTGIVETNTQATIIIAEQTDITNKEPMTKITEEQVLEEAVISKRRNTTKDTPFESGTKVVEVITQSPIEENNRTTTPFGEFGFEFSESSIIVGEKIIPVTEKKVEFQIPEVPVIEQKSQTPAPPVQGELQIPKPLPTTTEAIPAIIVTNAPETTTYPTPLTTTLPSEIVLVETEWKETEINGIKKSVKINEIEDEIIKKQNKVISTTTAEPQTTKLITTEEVKPIAIIIPSITTIRIEPMTIDHTTQSTKYSTTQTVTDEVVITESRSNVEGEITELNEGESTPENILEEAVTSELTVTDDTTKPTEELIEEDKTRDIEETNDVSATEEPSEWETSVIEEETIIEDKPTTTSQGIEVVSEIMSENVVAESVVKVCREETLLRTKEGQELVFVTEIEETNTSKRHRPLTEVILKFGQKSNYTIQIPQPQRRNKIHKINVQEIEVYFKPNIRTVYEIPIKSDTTLSPTKRKTIRIDTPKGTIVFTIHPKLSGINTNVIITTKEETPRKFKYILPVSSSQVNEEVDQPIEEDQRLQKITLRKMYVFQTPPNNYLITFQVKPNINDSVKQSDAEEELNEVIEKIFFQTPSENVTLELNTNEKSNKSANFKLGYEPENGKSVVFEFPGIPATDSNLHKFQMQIKFNSNLFILDFPQNPETQDISIIVVRPTEKYVYELPAFSVYDSRTPSPKKKEPIKLLKKKKLIVTTLPPELFDAEVIPNDQIQLQTFTTILTKDRKKVTIISIPNRDKTKPNIVQEIILDTKPEETRIRFIETIITTTTTTKKKATRLTLTSKDQPPQTFEFPPNEEVEYIEENGEPTIRFKPKGKATLEFTLPDLKTVTENTITSIVTIRTIEDKVVTFVYDLDPKSTSPSMVNEIILEGEDKKIKIKLPEENPRSKNPFTIIFTDKFKNGVTKYKFPVSGDSDEPTISTPQGIITFNIKNSPKSTLVIKFKPKEWTLLKTYTYTLLNVVVEKPTKKPIKLTIYYQTSPPNSKKVGFVTTVKELDGIHTNPSVVSAIVFETFTKNITIPLPVADLSSNSLKLLYPQSSGKQLYDIYVFPGFTYKKNAPLSRLLVPGDDVNELIVKFPSELQPSANGITFILLIKGTGKKLEYEIPYLNLPSYIPPRKSRGIFEITFSTVDKRTITISTTGEPEDPNHTPMQVVEFIFHLPNGTDIPITFSDDPSWIGTSLQLTHTERKSGNIMLYEFPEIPFIKTTKAKRITYKPIDSSFSLIFDIPTPDDETRSGIIFLLKMDADGNEISYEIPGFALRGNVPMSKPIPMEVTFQTLEGQQVLFRTVLPPGQDRITATTMYRIRYVGFEVDGKNVSIKVSKTIAPSSDDPKWIRLKYESTDPQEAMDFEIPGVKSDVRGRRRKLEFNSPDGKLIIIIPSVNDKEKGLELKLFIPKNKERVYLLPGFIQAAPDMELDPGDTETEGSLEEEFNLGRSFNGRGTSKNLLFFYPGWKLQYQNLTPRASLDHEDDIFYGLGNCPYTPTPPTQLNSTKTNEELVRFYLRVMRVDCLTEKRAYILALLYEDYLVIENKMFQVPSKLKLLTQPKLSTKQAQRLSSSFEMNALSKTFVMETRDSTKYPKSPDSMPISRSVNFLTEMTMNYMATSMRLSRTHFIRLSRHLVRTLKIVFTKLIQDGKEVERCEDCSEDLLINQNDQIQIMSLMQFIMHGLEPVDQGKIGVDGAFTLFFTQNKRAIQSRVNAY